MLIGFPIDVKCFQSSFSNDKNNNSNQKIIEIALLSISNGKIADEIERRMRKLKMVNAELFPEFLSLEAYCTDLAINGSTVDNLNGIQLRSPLGNRYTHIIPIYLSEAHFQRSENHLKTLISVICCGIDGSEKSDYHPSMFVKVYPALMNKQIVSLLKCQTYDSEMLLTAFANLLRTYRYVCSKDQSVQEINDKHVKEFCGNEKHRTKEWTNDLGELLFKMSTIDQSKFPGYTFENMASKKIFYEEFFARQIFWVDKYWKQKRVYNFFKQFHDASTKLKSLNVAETDEKIKVELQDQCCKLLNQFFEASQISLRLLLFNIESLRTFVTPEFDANLDSNYGLLNKDRIQAFRKSMEEIKGLTKLSQFFQRSSCPIQSSEAAFRLIMKAVIDAQRFRYCSQLI
uniref:Uncharacterized protein n=1 Tax=Panagrolaimus superbus TaxID=310955 RepID=A0A914YTT9_9BILA